MVSTSCTRSYIATNKNTKVRSFKSSENIQKKEGGPDCTVLNDKFFSVNKNKSLDPFRAKEKRS